MGYDDGIRKTYQPKIEKQSGIILPYHHPISNLLIALQFSFTIFFFYLNNELFIVNSLSILDKQPVKRSPRSITTR